MILTHPEKVQGLGIKEDDPGYKVALFQGNGEGGFLSWEAKENLTPAGGRPTSLLKAIFYKGEQKRVPIIRRDIIKECQLFRFEHKEIITREGEEVSKRMLKENLKTLDCKQTKKEVLAYLGEYAF